MMSFAYQMFSELGHVIEIYSQNTMQERTITNDCFYEHDVVLQRILRNLA